MARKINKLAMATKMAKGQAGVVRTAGDSKVCAACQARGGKYSATGRPPFHPNCRCGETNFAGDK